MVITIVRTFALVAALWSAVALAQDEPINVPSGTFAAGQALCNAAVDGDRWDVVDSPTARTPHVCIAGTLTPLTSNVVDSDPAVVWDNAATAYPANTITSDAGSWYRNITGVNTATSPSADAVNWAPTPAPYIPPVLATLVELQTATEVAERALSPLLLRQAIDDRVPQPRILPAPVLPQGQLAAINAAGDGYELVTPLALPAQVSAPEIAAGTETAVRGYSPADVQSQIDTRSPLSDWAAVNPSRAEILNKPALATQIEAETGTETAERAWSPERVRQAVVAHDEIPAWQPAPVTYPVNKLVVFGGDLFRAATGTNTATDPANDPTNWIDLTIPIASALELETGTEVAERTLSPALLAGELKRREACQLVTGSVTITSTPACVYLDNGVTPVNVTLPAATTGFIDFYRSAQATGDVTLVRGNAGDTIVDGADAPQTADYLIDASRVWFRLTAVAAGDWRILYVDTPSLAASVIRQGGYDASTNTPDLSLANNQVAPDGRFYTFYVTAAGTQTIPGLGSVTVAVDDILEYWTGGFRLISAADQIQVSDTLEGNGLPATPVRHKLPNVITAATTAACGDNLIADSTGGAYNVSVPAGAPVGCRWLLSGTPAAATNNVQLDPGADTLLGFGPTDLPFIINDASQAVLEKVTLTTWAVRY